MPLSVRARFEVYIPDQPSQAYQDLVKTLKYLSNFGQIINDRITLIYTDTPFDLQENLEAVSNYSDKLRESAFQSLDEEAILVAVWPLYHSN